ncbi:nuclear protein [Coprinopsis cinerea AmutBmut pab1-1]|nr:nuclear protein [Coprinopsis cinerea AmutBmut pab1-1]
MPGEEAPTVKFKRRRLQGACDICRQKKIRCDSAKMPDNRCSNCIAFNAECTHVHVNQKTVYKFRPTPKRGLREPESLDEHREKMNPLLETILSATYQAPTNPAIIRNTLISLASYARLLEQRVPKSGATAPSPLSISTQTRTSPESETSPIIREPKYMIDPTGSPTSEDSHESNSNGNGTGNSNNVDTQLSNVMEKNLTINAKSNRFFGPSSSGMLVKAALEFSRQYATNPQACNPGAIMKVAAFKRPQYWTVQQWEIVPPEPQQPFVFPEPDLLEHLVDTYFRMCNVFIPVLHRPTFEKSVKAGLHLKDRGFGGCLLAVCAVASRYSSDKRVIPEGVTSELSCGYQWFKQLRLFRKSFIRTPSLYELQTYWISATYLHGASTPEDCWYLIGMAIRAAQDAGIHRRHRGPPTVQSELRKRIWWALVLADIVVSISNGRPRAIHASDFDVDLPIECDDEYWENPDPALAFKQPQGKPAQTTCLVKLLELFNVLSSAEAVFYATKKTVPPDASSPEEWEQHNLASLDSLLNGWVDTVPEHLRWDPNNPNPIFFDQSALIFSTFYWVQILIHRPFISIRSKLSLSSLAICTNAARACSRIMELHSQRGFLALPQVQATIFKSGLILMLSIWRAKQAGIPLDEQKEMESVYRCARLLAMFERRWHPAGRFSDVLRALAAVSNLPLPESSIDSGAPAWWSASPSASATQDPQPSPPSSQPATSEIGCSLTGVFNFPVYSSELSVGPVFESFQLPSAAGTPPSSAGVSSAVSSAGGQPFDFEAMFAQSFAAAAGGGPAPVNNDWDSFMSSNGGNLLGAMSPQSGGPQVPQAGPSNPSANEILVANGTSPIPNFFPQGIGLDNMTIWAGVPTSLDWTDWSNYIANVDSALNQDNGFGGQFQQQMF